MPHPNGGKFYFSPKHTYNEAIIFVEKNNQKFKSTTGEYISATCGYTKNKKHRTIVFKGENSRHGNVCFKCWGYRENCQGTRIGQCSEALDNFIQDTEGLRYSKSNHKESIKKNIFVEQYTVEEEKELFLHKYYEAIMSWIKSRSNKIIQARLSYSWKNKPTLQCVQERNEISRAIVLSRIKNQGGIDLDALDSLMKWGFNRLFPLRNVDEVIRITKKAFDELDNRNIVESVKILLDVKGVGISRASKILGLFDQENLCIYDSRVGYALNDLKYKYEKLILCPPGQNRSGDSVSNIYQWAFQYQKLIWTLEIIRDWLNERGCTYRLADIEMALFMLGK